MFIKKNKIIEYAVSEDHYPDIELSKKFIPDWYKKTKRFLNTNLDPISLPAPMSFKMCSPFSDSFTTGYIIPLAVDIAVSQSDDQAIITWNDYSQTYVEKRAIDTNKELPIPIGCRPDHYTWKTKHYIKVPKGYSFLVTHPLNRFDLPFFTMSGIVDEDFILYPGSIPFFISKDFTGIIPAGTPIAQIIPFKNNSWKLIKNDDIKKNGNILLNKIKNHAFGYYKNNYWKRKNFT